MEMTYRRGDVFNADLGIGIGSEQQGSRPVVIIQNDIGNRFSPTVIIAPMTTQTIRKRPLPIHCSFSSIDGLSEPSFVLLEQIRTIDKQRLKEKVGHLTPEQIEELDYCLSISLGFINPISQPMELCLCRTCLESFANTNQYRIARKDLVQKDRDICTYCNYRKGLDYIVTPKKVSYPRASKNVRDRS